MPRIEEMFAFVAEDSGPEDEGLVGTNTGDGWMPLIGADMARVESLKPIARGIAEATGKKIKIIHFTQREEIGVV